MLNRFVSLAVGLTIAGALIQSGCNLQLPVAEADQEDSGSNAGAGQPHDGGGMGGIACTEDAMMVCVQTAPGSYEQRGVGRSGPKCEFAIPEDAVEAKFCEAQQGGACTDDAKLVCVETGPGVYERRGLGRQGPSCEFPQLPGEVADEKCGGFTDDSMACKVLEAKVELEMELMRSCEADADCTVVAGACPFGCYDAVHRAASADAVTAAESAYRDAGCKSCDYGCAEPPQESQLRCVENRCVIAP